MISPFFSHITLGSGFAYTSHSSSMSDFTVAILETGFFTNRGATRNKIKVTFLYYYNQFHLLLVEIGIMINSLKIINFLYLVFTVFFFQMVFLTIELLPNRVISFI